jgi:glycosyltransferase involved in cell wall biosynthesis
MLVDRPELSIIIPAYREAGVIGATLESVSKHLTASQVTHEIIIVDDGSPDETSEIVRAVATRHPSIRLIQFEHRGKGAAIKRGMLTAHGRYVLFMDADHSTHIEEWQKIAPWLRDGYDVVIGSRKMPGAIVTVRQPLLREFMGRGFTWLTNVMLGTRASDITCGFKGFHAKAALRIFQLQCLEGWGFDAEILFIAKRLGYQIKEVPVVWANDARTKVQLWKDSGRSLKELLAIRLGAWRGRYPKELKEDRSVRSSRKTAQEEGCSHP